MKNLPTVPGKLTLAIAIVAATTVISACGSSSKPRPTSQGFSSGSPNQIADLTRRIEELTSQLEAARAEAAAAKNIAENAQATADAAQIMAASTDDRIETMFQKSVFK